MKMNDSGNIFTQFFAWVAALASAIGFTTQDLVFIFFGAAGLLISLVSYINGRVDANRRRREDEKRTKWSMTTFKALVIDPLTSVLLLQAWSLRHYKRKVSDGEPGKVERGSSGVGACWGIRTEHPRSVPE